MEVFKKNMSNMFSANQLHRINNNKSTNWTEEDIKKGIRYHYSGPHLYQILRKDGFPFPAPSTLREWIRKVEIKAGEIEISFKCMENANLTKFEKVIKKFCLTLL